MSKNKMPLTVGIVRDHCFPFSIQGEAGGPGIPGATGPRGGPVSIQRIFNMIFSNLIEGTAVSASSLVFLIKGHESQGWELALRTIWSSKDSDVIISNSIAKILSNNSFPKVTLKVFKF